MALPLVGAALKVAAPYAVSRIGSALFGRGRRSDPSVDAYAAAFDRSVQEEAGRARRFSDEYESAITGFDPDAAYRTSMRGAFGDFERAFEDNLQRLRGQQVGMGRFDSSLATRDEDRLFTDMGERLLDRMDQGAMQTARMNLDRIGAMGAYGERARDRMLDAYFGRYATERQARDQRRAGTMGLVGNIGGALINAGATYLANRR